MVNHAINCFKEVAIKQIVVIKFQLKSRHSAQNDLFQEHEPLPSNMLLKRNHLFAKNTMGMQWELRSTRRVCGPWF